MPKILKPYTIIPPELYVQRDADRQIKFIIEDMGRPGYVLVSRQMGKTNLLLNAKRRFETPDDVFVYIDLSTHFENAKSCFENIINIALETNHFKFNSIIQTILERRKDVKETPPHKQHVNELRLLLNCISGKLVIILDEIDVLTKTHYSDQIFAQIRSIYFSRANYKELERLTYILSGVVEPTEIIKDPKISPFNIGQKIFLNDFNKTEFLHFIEVSQMKLNTELKERIFYWTNGNPRMTWDLCSEVENIIHDTHNIDVPAIDKIVEVLYLTTFDKPPIDNIRELVKKDIEIRTSIIEIFYNKGETVSDRIKSKLYLTGIINYNELNIHIKNRIIEKSLSLEWLKDLEEADKGLKKIAVEQYDKGNFEESLSSFEKFLIDHEFEESEKSLYYYFMAYAAYRNLDFQKSLSYLDKCNFDSEDELKWFYKTLNLKGLVYLYLEKLDDSLACFLKVINSGRKDEIYIRSLINYGSISLMSSKQEARNEAIKIFNGIINETNFDKNKLKKDFLSELKTISHYNLAQILVFNKEYEDAIINYKQAFDFSNDNSKPAIILKYLSISKDDEEKSTYLKELITLVTEERIKPNEKDPEKPLDFSFDHLKNLLIYTFLNNPVQFERIKSVLSVFGDKGIAQNLFDLAIYSIEENKDWDTSNKILSKLHKNDDIYNTPLLVRYQILRLLAYNTKAKESIHTLIDYTQLFERERLETIDLIDFDIFANLIYNLVENQRYFEALKYINVINDVREEVSEELLINYLVIWHLELNTYFFLHDKTNSKRKAEEILSFVKNDKIKEQKSNLLGDTGFDIIKQNAESILRPQIKGRAQIIKSKSYGRNDIVKVRYRDGTIVVTKYKKIATDLGEEKCFILN